MPEKILDHDEYNRRVRALVSGQPPVGATPGGTPKLLSFLKRRKGGQAQPLQVPPPEQVPKPTKEYPFIGARK